MALYSLVIVFIIITCVLLTLIVLVQNSKGGGLASTFSSSNQLLGVRKTADFLEKATWTLVGALVVLCLIASMTIPRTEGVQKESIVKSQVENIGNQSLPKMPKNTTNDQQQTNQNQNQQNQNKPKLPKK